MYFCTAMNKTKNRHKGGVNLWGQHTSTVISISLVLFVFSLLLFISYHSYHLTHDMQEQITYKVDLLPDVSDSLAVSLQKTIQGYDYVKKVDYISKDEAASIFQEEIGEDFVDFIGYNPLYPSLMVNFRSGLLPDKDQSLLDNFVHTVSQMPGVSGVQYQENVIEEVTQDFYIIDWILIIIAVLLLFVTIVLISSTIRIAIYAKHQTIQTMRLVGATNAFIARPFLWRSVWFGLLGAVIAIALTAGAVVIYSREFGLNILNEAYYIPYAIMAGIIIVAGILISWLSTAIAVRRYLRK